MQSVDAIHGFRPKLGAGDAQAGKGGAGIVQLGLDFRILRIHPNADFNRAAGFADGFTVFFQLTHRIKDHMGRQLQNFRKSFFDIGLGKV